MDEAVRDLVALGKEYFQRGDYQLARGQLEQVAARGTNFADVHHMLGVIHHHLGDFPAAQRALNHGLTWWGYRVPALLEAGVVLALGLGLLMVAIWEFSATE